MKRSKKLSAGILGLVLATGVVVAPSLATTESREEVAQPTPTMFEVDLVHSSLVFKIKHQGLAYFYGRFNDFSGQFNFDEKNPENSLLRIEVIPASVDTNSDGRDEHLRSPDFFNVGQFDYARFSSSSVKSLGNGKFQVEGELEIKGVAKKVSLEVQYNGEKDGRRGGKVAGFDTTITFDRNDYGITHSPGGLGEDVTLFISMEGRSS